MMAQVTALFGKESVRGKAQARDAARLHDRIVIPEGKRHIAEKMHERPGIDIEVRRPSHS
jgi:hypothetical protein